MLVISKVYPGNLAYTPKIQLPYLEFGRVASLWPEILLVPITQFSPPRPASFLNSLCQVLPALFRIEKEPRYCLCLFLLSE